MLDRIAFGQRLRRERERRGVSLETIAQSTKIKASLLDALERGDISHWPAGIFGRGFLRAYLGAINLPAEPLVAEFQRLGSALSMGSVAATVEASDLDHLRLTLEPVSGSGPATAGRLVAALAEVAMVLATAALIAWLSGAGFWIVATVTASIGSAAATLWLGRSPALWLAGRLRSRLTHAPSDDAPPDTGADPKFTLAGH